MLGLFLPATQFYAQAFVDKGFGARTLALGKSVVALTGDPSFQFYNPASIGYASSPSVYTSFTNLYPDVIDANFNFLVAAGTYSLGSVGVIGIGVTQFAPTAWAERTLHGTFATRMFFDDLSLGGTVKLLQWGADAPKGENAVPEPALSYTGLTVDIGATFVVRDIVEENDLQIGGAFHNITQPSIAANGSNDAVLPADMMIGAAYISNKYNYSLSTVIEIRKGNLRAALGSEILLLRTDLIGLHSEFFLRIGGSRAIKNDTQGDYNGGFGIAVDSFILDYSYSYQSEVRNIGGINSISLGYEF